ncbi:hypothetical protein CONPUDRAFT_164302 [Coniophora puteana RWD-64-598 SS2]|uniref:F-box domain-containing protein n=1 Tax=Coniophora puteana (strain RWD-64-598) TaxID=741705 RepID=A0A5M3MW06_CONPW|nr:uncharacterized protein CONPUDRAFT_164302 [Coniophora puteana RWD-64-598 SS2]EIW83339.1 hypothetical protein CONPUDRAFT_164302 [Coniophora puteana RWD-64-598 SS2]
MATPSATKGASSLSLPAELWIEVFAHATHVEGVSERDIRDRVKSLGLYGERSGSTEHEPALRQSIVSTRLHLPLVCKTWYELATPFLYQSVWVDNRSLPSLLAGPLFSSPSVALKGSAEPLGALVKRVDLIMDLSRMPMIGPGVAIKEYYDDLGDLLQSLHNISIIDISIIPPRPIVANAMSFPIPNCVIDAACSLGQTLEVFNIRTELAIFERSQTIKLLHSAPNLRVLSCRYIEALNSGVTSSQSIESLSCGRWLSLSGSCRDCFPRLRHLTLREHDSLASPDMQTFLEGVGSNLETVCCAQGHTVYQSSWSVIARTCPRLTRIVLSVPEDALFQDDMFYFFQLPPVKYLGFKVYRTQSSTEPLEAAQLDRTAGYGRIWQKIQMLLSFTPSIQVVEFLTIDRPHKEGIEAVPPELAGRLQFRYVYQD